jgi:enamine deaminase RidA (YjgF/YER057c/UK114 family)
MKPGREKQEVVTGLGRNLNSVTGALVSNGILYAAIIPRCRDGAVNTGSAEAQIRLAFDNLTTTLEAAGGTLDDVVQIVVYLTDPAAFNLMIDIYKTYFTKAPYPNRATIFAAGLAVPGMIIELVVQAHLGSKPTQ